MTDPAVPQQLPAPIPAPIPAPAGAVSTPAPPYRFVVADDLATWSTAEQAGSLLALPQEARLAAWERLGADGCAVVVICSPKQAGPIRRDSALARVGADTRIIVLPLAVGPLAQLVGARIGQTLIAAGLDRPVSELVVSLPELVGSLLDVALVRSVTSLDLPGIKLGHHLLSYLPGNRRFAVQITPVGQVVRRDRAGDLRADLAPPGFDPAFGALLTVLGPRPVPPRLLEQCGIVDQPVIDQAQLDLPGYWHDPEATEVVVRPADLVGWVLSQLPALERWPCAWCAEPMAAPMVLCPFCGHARR